MDQSTNLGATLDASGVTFSIFSANADRMELILFDEAHSVERVVDVNERTGDVWRVHVLGIGVGQRYGYRVYGPWDPDRGHRFNGTKILLDPYACAISRMPAWDESLFGYDRSRDDRFVNLSDSVSHAPIGIVTGAGVQKRFYAGPQIPWTNTVIYETHVKGLSIRQPDISPALRGTYLGAASDAVISHLKSLGVTTIEFLPIYAAVQDERLVRNGLSQYWGYNPLSFFAPDPRFTVGGAGDAVKECKTMINRLHDHGFEVILDVVYNHTGEGDHTGPTLSWRGIDNASYYVPAEDPRFLCDTTGCGNTLRAEHLFVRRLIMDSLRYWVEEMHVDGFRFDLAPTLLRERGNVHTQSGWLHMIQQDPVLSRIKLIAEPWDLGDHGYQLGMFPPPWREWNDKYRNLVRRYWSGEAGITGEFATRISGSSDVFSVGHRRPSSSINYVTSHDGFTLRDMVSFTQKYNDANLEQGRDGTDMNYSQNCGQEGATVEAEILAKRDRLRRSLLTTLFVSQGVPMLLGGDEFGRTQQGNNNPYCQDNEISWYDWNLRVSDVEHLKFVRELIAFRRSHPSLRRNRFLTGQVGEYGLPDAIWWHPAGRVMESADWAHTRAFGMWLAAPDMLLICFNPTGESIRFKLPDEYMWNWGLGWGGSALEAQPGLGGGYADVAPQSVFILRVHS